MGILYKVKRSSLIGVILIALITEFTSVYCNFMLSTQFEKFNKYAVVAIALIAAAIFLAIIYYIYQLILRKEDVEYKEVLIVNLAATLTIGAILQTIVMISTSASTNTLANVLIGVITYGLLGWLNWTSLEVSRQAKINISIWTLILFVIAIF
ncbi:hypothetical protein [Companilactobacillus sp.]|jgi:predicted transporter|uniref:hypothetical protein n=1 Tax=Companilactobacillus sp. TaxID=2767905 RepID=UPI0025C60C07|nr:hypothetical protein [Companilactobacillus sp.]MCH4008533.1 hypothetical protein [Companilactobacillus sp.]MCH4051288.1 hypothetical protein [Companilactobacillus sp.]MCH4076476.1 hypothetical protein [Companilactobacillus sp.]MCH4125051.1 hypothetical protein [Companilactobacillus sp.]MCH4131592.1 hypothetical protein [Companilactobacillus sp.]